MNAYEFYEKFRKSMRDIGIKWQDFESATIRFAEGELVISQDGRLTLRTSERKVAPQKFRSRADQVDALADKLAEGHPIMMRGPIALKEILEAENRGASDAALVQSFSALWIAEPNDVLKSIEYASRKDSLTDAERLDSVRALIRAALKCAEQL